MFKLNKLNKKGFTVIELLVVLAIFAAISGVAIFNFGAFQGRVDIKNLASDIALKTIEAQKSSLSGQFPPAAQGTPSATWKPSYGVYFNTASRSNFIYFVDLNTENGLYDSSSCPPVSGGECVEQITITKGNTVSSLDVYYTGDANPHSLTDLTVTFQRPNSSAKLISNGSLLAGVSFVQITITTPSPNSLTAFIKIYPSGRIQVN